MTTHRILAEFTVEAPSRDQAEAWVQAAAVGPFTHTRRGTGRILPERTRSFEEAQEEAMPTPPEPPAEEEDRFFCITCTPVGSFATGYTWDHHVDPKPFLSHSEAWDYGLKTLNRSDDFEVGVLRGGRWVATLWGPDAEVLDDEPELLEDIPLPDGFQESES